MGIPNTVLLLHRGKAYTIFYSYKVFTFSNKYLEIFLNYRITDPYLSPF